jgi:REP-associated tyrosine transposase
MSSVPCRWIVAMPRSDRPAPAGICSHLVTRGNARAVVFHGEADYAAFLRLMECACERLPLDVLAWCLMPNHVHLVVRPCSDRDLGRWMHWLLTAHVGTHRARHATVGRIWQGRYKSFPIQADRHLLTVLRYVERNPVRAGLVSHSADWAWSSARARLEGGHEILAPSPVDLPTEWSAWVDEPLASAEIASVRIAAARGRPFGEAAWVRGAADRFGLHSTLVPRGRPKGSSRSGGTRRPGTII